MDKNLEYERSKWEVGHALLPRMQNEPKREKRAMVTPEGLWRRGTTLGRGVLDRSLSGAHEGLLASLV